MAHAADASARGAISLPLAGGLAALAGFATLQLWAAALAGWVFEYPLDDVYIHLAMAEGIAAGGYGFNPGEAASASSSILFPFLLAPFAGNETQRYLPLVWNALGIAALGALWGRAVALSGLGGMAALALALLGPIGLNMPGVAFSGMENTLHAAVSLAIILGLWTFLTSGRIAGWFVAACVLSPLLRYEGLALVLTSAAVIVLRGRPGAGLGIAAAAVAPVLAFSAWLVSLGLEPVPGPILAKVLLVANRESGVARYAASLLKNLGLLQGWLVAGILVGVLILRAAIPPEAPAARTLLGAVALASAAHLVLGQVGWMHRYEHYVVVGLLAAALIALPSAPGGLRRLGRAAVAASVGLAALSYYPTVLGYYVWNPRAIHVQQAQMARFLRDYLPWTVAVNDLGWVSWQYDPYVLDLWGLGSPDTRAVRLAGETPGWAAPLAMDRGIRAAIIYDTWFGAAPGPDWVRVAKLNNTRIKGFIGDFSVSFYVTDAADAPAMTAALRAFAPTLPAHTEIVFEEPAG